MTTETIRQPGVQPISAELLRAKLGAQLLDIETGPTLHYLRCHRDSLLDVVATLKSDHTLQCDYLRVIAGVDYNHEFEIVYIFLSLALKHTVGVKVRVPREEPLLLSLTAHYTTADWQEREIFDLFGVVFTGHPDLRRILMPDWWEGHPLRKDYESAVHLRQGEAEPGAEAPGYIPPMEWLKNRKPAALFGQLNLNGQAKTEIKDDAERTASVMARPEEDAPRRIPSSMTQSTEQAQTDYAAMTIEQISAITDRVERSRAKAAWRKVHHNE